MKTATSMMTKMMYRNRTRTILSVILLIAATLALCLQVGEYASAKYRFEKAIGNYYGVGTVESSPAKEVLPRVPTYIKEDKRIWDTGISYQTLDSEQLDAISEMPYISQTDRRIMTAGVSEEFIRLDDRPPYYNYSARCIVEGTFSGFEEGDLKRQESVELGSNKIHLENCSLVAGICQRDIEDESITIYALPIKSAPGSTDSIGGKRKYALYDETYMYDTKYVRDMNIGERYVFVLRYEPMDDEEYYIADYLTTTEYDAIWHVEGKPDWRSSAEFSKLQELADIINSDLHTFDMVYTEDMSTIFRFAEEKMAIAEGRSLTPADSEADAQVCVISNEVAEAYSLKVGDKLTFNLGTETFEQYKNLGAQAVLPQRFSISDTQVTLEIVGIYTDTDGSVAQAREPNWCYSVNTVFVPASLLSKADINMENHKYAPPEFSVKVDAKDISKFADEVLPQLKEQGYTVHFYDRGWISIEESFYHAQTLSIIKIAIFSVVAMLIIVLDVYLFIGREKKNYAIMRALGTTVSDSSRALLKPLTVISVVSVIIGAGVAAIFKSSGILALLISAAAELVFAIIIAEIMLHRLGKKAPLRLLQGDKNGKKS